MKAHPLFKHINIVHNFLKRKKLVDFASKLLLILQILYFGSLAPKALLVTARYLSVSESNTIIRVLSDLVESECPASYDEQESH